MMKKKMAPKVKPSPTFTKNRWKRRWRAPPRRTTSGRSTAPPGCVTREIRPGARRRPVQTRIAARGGRFGGDAGGRRWDYARIEPTTFLHGYDGAGTSRVQRWVGRSTGKVLAGDALGARGVARARVARRVVGRGDKANKASLGGRDDTEVKGPPGGVGAESLDASAAPLAIGRVRTFGGLRRCRRPRCACAAPARRSPRGPPRTHRAPPWTRGLPRQPPSSLANCSPALAAWANAS